MRTWLIVALTLWNLTVFAMYGIDKYRAVHHQWRISEKTLILSAVMTGGLGAFLGARLFHHKTRKWYFWLAWIVGLVIDAVLIFFILELRNK